jgi:hypothetical protein
MSNIQGTGGSITLPSGCNAKIQKWSAQIIGEEFIHTGFGDNAWETGDIISGQLIGEAIGIIMTTTPAPAAYFSAVCGVSSFEGTITLTAANGKELSFDALVLETGIDRAETDDGTSVLRYSFESTGPVKQSWS